MLFTCGMRPGLWQDRSTNALTAGEPEIEMEEMHREKRMSHDIGRERTGTEGWWREKRSKTGRHREGDVTWLQGGRTRDRHAARNSKRESVGGWAGRFSHEFARRAAQTALPLSLLRHSRAEHREQDYPDADRRIETHQPGRSWLLHFVSGPIRSLIAVMELFLFSSSLHPARKRGRGRNVTEIQGSLCF